MNIAITRFILRDKQLCNDKLLEFIKDNISEGNDINHKYNITGV